VEPPTNNLILLTLFGKVRLVWGVTNSLAYCLWAKKFYNNFTYIIRPSWGCFKVTNSLAYCLRAKKFYNHFLISILTADCWLSKLVCLSWRACFIKLSTAVMSKSTVGIGWYVQLHVQIRGLESHPVLKVWGKFVKRCSLLQHKTK
jgi:hypothetical protein